ncbi:MAG: ATP-binding protein [Candidatus Thorarchaeota archaeon]
MTALLDTLETTEQVITPKEPFQRIIGQEHAVTIVQSAVKQRRHVLLCGEPGIGKSMLAKAAYSLLDPPIQEIQLRHNNALPDRPIVVISHIKDKQLPAQQKVAPGDVFYSTPDRLPIEIAIKMGYRCPKCSNLSVPSEPTCQSCGTDKRCDWSDSDSYHGLFRMLDVVSEPALRMATSLEEIGNESYHIIYERLGETEIAVTREKIGESSVVREEKRNYTERVLVSRDASRFVRVSGASHVELLGDVKHDPYGSAESLGMAAYQRVIPGAIHEAHEGILYIDEIAALGQYQSHLLTAMQDKIYPISGHNPMSSGASVRVDDVPCDFILFASCNTENISGILPALRSRIRGYGYEIMLSSWTEKNQKNLDEFVRFIAQTVEEDGKVPHFAAKSIAEVLRVAEKMALQFDGRRNALTLRLRELGGLVRIAGDLAVQEGEELVQPHHVASAEVLSRGIDMGNIYSTTHTSPEQANRDYFF